MTKLGRLVKAGKIKSMEEIYLHSLPIKEYQIVDFFLPKLKDEVMKVRNDCSLRLSWSPRKECMLTVFREQTDQARAKADPRRTAYPFQGHCRHWRQRRPRRSRHQDKQGGRHGHSRSHHHRKALRRPHPSRLLGYQPR